MTSHFSNSNTHLSFKSFSCWWILCRKVKRRNTLHLLYLYSVKTTNVLSQSKAFERKLSWIWKNNHRNATTKSVTFSQLLGPSGSKYTHFSPTNNGAEANFCSLIHTDLSHSLPSFSHSHSLTFPYINLIWNCIQIPQQHLCLTKQSCKDSKFNHSLLSEWQKNKHSSSCIDILIEGQKL